MLDSPIIVEIVECEDCPGIDGQPFKVLLKKEWFPEWINADNESTEGIQDSQQG